VTDLYRKIQTSTQEKPLNLSEAALEHACKALTTCCPIEQVLMAIFAPIIWYHQPSHEITYVLLLSGASWAKDTGAGILGQKRFRYLSALCGLLVPCQTTPSWPNVLFLQNPFLLVPAFISIFWGRELFVFSPKLALAWVQLGPENSKPARTVLVQRFVQNC
jgi:hypothetical protein